MKVQHGKDLANHSGPESCGGACEGAAEALTGETGGSAIEPRNPKSGTPTPLSDAEGNMNQGDRCESWGSPARSETLHTPGSFLHRSWEISAEPGETPPGDSGKAESHTPGQSTVEKLRLAAPNRREMNGGRSKWWRRSRRQLQPAADIGARRSPARSMGPGSRTGH